MAKPQVIVLTYTGPEPDNTMLIDLNQAVLGVGGYAAAVHVMSADDIAKACAKFVMSEMNEPTPIEDNPIMHAVVYIGEKFAHCLTEEKNIAQFSAEIARNAAMAHFAGGDTMLLKAIEILSTHNGKIDAKLANKYGFNRAVLTAIRAAYKVSLK